MNTPEQSPESPAPESTTAAPEAAAQVQSQEAAAPVPAPEAAPVEEKPAAEPAPVPAPEAAPTAEAQVVDTSPSRLGEESPAAAIRQEAPVEEKPEAQKSLPPVEQATPETVQEKLQDGGLPLYQCHKRVRALKIRELNEKPRTGFQKPDGSLLMTPWETGFDVIELSPEFVKRHNPEVGGFYVVYQDGYVSYSPQKAFEDGYTLLT